MFLVGWPQDGGEVRDPQGAFDPNRLLFCEATKIMQFTCYHSIASLILTNSTRRLRCER